MGETKAVNPKEHWNKVYISKSADSVSWFQPNARLSLEIIKNLNLPKDGPIIDVGGGASILVDELLGEGYIDITVLDLSAAALELSKSRLGCNAENVCWKEDDILHTKFPAQRFKLWHDRAVFHFLTHAGDRSKYVQQLMHSVAPGGHVLIATFAEDGPEKCSGLPVIRYTPENLHAELGNAFDLIRHLRENHQTPSGAIQEFVYCCFRRKN